MKGNKSDGAVRKISKDIRENEAYIKERCTGCSDIIIGR